MSRIDHLIFATPDLDRGSRVIRDLLGVEPVVGGSHDAWGTANRLVGMGPRTYLEILGPDPESPDPPSPRSPGLFGVGALREPRLAAWVVRVSDLASSFEAAEAAGYRPGKVLPGERRGPAGHFRWRITDPLADNESGALPLLIAWKGDRHPADRLGDQWRIREIRIRHPDPGRILRILDALGVHAEVSEGAPGISAGIAGPFGEAVLE